MADAKTLDIRGIMETIPHRFPMLMVDQVLDYELPHWLMAVKAVTRNEPFFDGHFPGEPIFPGVLQIEAAAQTSALLARLSAPETRGLMFFGQVKRFTFVKPVRPGDLLQIRAEFKFASADRGISDVELQVEGERVAKGTLIFAGVPERG